MHEKEIAILDFGSQYTHLIARRSRELGVLSRIYPNNCPANYLSNAYGIILSGGPKSANSDQKLDFDKKIFNLKIPILGLCYGHQLMACFFNGTVKSGIAREYGISQIEIKDSPIFNGIQSRTTVWMSHGDHVAQLPDGFESIGKSNSDCNAAMAHHKKQMYGFQFHPEVTHSIQGKKMIDNFIFKICGAEKNWDAEKMLLQIQEQIKKQAKGKKVFLLISGGVDSSVCYALLEKTLGKHRVYGLHIDHGLMRKNESADVKQILKSAGLDNLNVVNAQDNFLSALKNVVEPEEKRKIIGRQFVNITRNEMKKMKMTMDEWLIGQGTIYPDTIESGGTSNSEVIKTHHNRVAEIETMIKSGLIIEPIKDLYKDEVRQIGAMLGLGSELLNRHPFPGPGLGIRCLCSSSCEEQYPVEIKNFPEFNHKIYKLPIKSVGVQGDCRSYSNPALIIPKMEISDNDNLWEKISKISPLLTNRLSDINRVVLMLAGDKQKILNSTVHNADLSKKRLDLLKKLDAIITEAVLSEPTCKNIWQMPVVLAPFGYCRQESIIIRPVESEEAMTVSFGKLPFKLLHDIVLKIMASNAIDYIFYDITNKPPSTIEWE
ncbi:MAG: glutamine-hydrolyzing GMP synthase [bacterium]